MRPYFAFKDVHQTFMHAIKKLKITSSQIIEKWHIYIMKY